MESAAGICVVIGKAVVVSLDDFFTWMEVAKVVDYLDIGVIRRRFESDVLRLMECGTSPKDLLQYANCLKSSTAQVHLPGNHS